MNNYFLRNFLWLLLIFTSSWQARSEVIAFKTGSKIDVYIDKVLFTSYIFSKEEKYPFFFPVNGPSGAGVTSMRNGNYPHHSSLFFGCDRVNGGNFWQEGLDQGQIVSLGAEIAEQGNNRVVITDECIWKRQGFSSPVRDSRKITITSPQKEMFQIDFEISLEMLEDITILRTNHSLFSVRLDPDLAVISGGTMINAEGETGEKATFGKTSVWMDCYSSRLGKPEGIAILQQPSSRGFPSPWFTRDYGFFSPTPMYWPENEEKGIFVRKGEKIFLRYRVLVHSGDHLQAGIAERYKKYTSE